MTDPKKHRTRSGRTLSDEEIDAIATETEETDYDVEALRPDAVVDPPRVQDLPMSFRVNRSGVAGGD